jgi:hypothetical protein
LVTEFEASGLRQVEFCKRHGLALSTSQRGLKRRRTEAEGHRESEGLVEVKIARSRRSGGTESSVLEVLLLLGGIDLTPVRHKNWYRVTLSESDKV